MERPRLGLMERPRLRLVARPRLRLMERPRRGECCCCEAFDRRGRVCTRSPQNIGS
jgi:hypothetical protein